MHGATTFHRSVAVHRGGGVCSGVSVAGAILVSGSLNRAVASVCRRNRSDERTSDQKRRGRDAAQNS